MNSYSLFAQNWWLDAVAPGSWDEVTIEQGGKIIARLPFVIKKRYGFTMLTMPPLTPTLGPWIQPLTGKYTKRLAKEKQLMSELIEKLPKFDIFAQNFHPAITNWLPFYWHNFQQTTRYTYIIKDLSDLDQVWNNFEKSTKWSIRKAQNLVTVRTDLELDTFLEINRLSFSRQGKSLPYNYDLVSRIDQTCRERNCRKIFFAEDSRGQIHAAIYIVWDQYAAYYLMGGADPDLRNSGAMSLLIWEAIQFAATVTQSFDFEGSMIEPIERFFRSFGAKQTPYFHVSKINSLALKIYKDFYRWIKYK